MRSQTSAKRWLAAVAWLAVALGATTIATAQADGRVAAASSASGSAQPSATASARHDPIGYAPDPAPMRSNAQYVLTFLYNAGQIGLVGARHVVLPQPHVTARNTGRFAVELFSGPTLIERLRFDFPLVGADELAGKPHGSYRAPLRFEDKVVVSVNVMLPDSSRASHARLLDRATGQTWILPWPPDQPDAGPSDAATEADAPSDARADAGADAQLDAAIDALNPDAQPLPPK